MFLYVVFLVVISFAKIQIFSFLAKYYSQNHLKTINQILFRNQLPRQFSQRWRAASRLLCNWRCSNSFERVDLCDLIFQVSFPNHLSKATPISILQSSYWFDTLPLLKVVSFRVGHTQPLYYSSCDRATIQS